MMFLLNDRYQLRSVARHFNSRPFLIGSILPNICDVVALTFFRALETIRVTFLRMRDKCSASKLKSFLLLLPGYRLASTC